MYEQLLIEQGRMYKELCGVIEQFVSVFDGLVNRLSGDWLNLFRIRLQKAYTDNMADCPAALTDASEGCSTSGSRWSDNEAEAGSGLSASKRGTGGKTTGHQGDGKSRGRR